MLSCYFWIDTHWVGGIPTVVVKGELDLASRAAFGQTLDAACGHGLDVRVDLKDLAFMDATALGMLAEVHGRLRSAGRRLQVINCPAASARVLVVTGLGRLIDQATFAGPLPLG